MRMAQAKTAKIRLGVPSLSHVITIILLWIVQNVSLTPDNWQDLWKPGMPQAKRNYIYRSFIYIISGHKLRNQYFADMS